MSTIDTRREMLDAQPLKAAILRDAALCLTSSWRDAQPQDRGLGELAARTGINDRCLRRVLHQQHVTLDFADHYCCATNRLLYDLYPELLEATTRDTLTWWCKRCRADVDQDVTQESKLRMVVRCPDCGRNHHIERTKRGAPVNPFPALPVSTEQIVTDYKAGMTGLAVAKKYGFKNEDGVYGRLIKAGVARRSRVTEAGIQAGRSNLAAYREATAQRAYERAERLRELWLAGVPTKTIAAEIGVTTTHAKAIRQQLGLPRRKPGGRGWA